eukprot:2533911-Pleurochrysis_carterae.AAC.5
MQEENAASWILCRRPGASNNGNTDADKKGKGRSPSNKRAGNSSIAVLKTAPEKATHVAAHARELAYATVIRCFQYTPGTRGAFL